MSHADDTDDRTVIRVLKALGDPNRYRMVQEIAAAGELSCGQLGKKFELSQPTISHHLKILVDAGVLLVRQHAQHHFISVNHPLLEETAGSLPMRLPRSSASSRPRKVAPRTTVWRAPGAEATPLLLAWINDWALGARIEPLRARLLAGARGRVLDLGAGTGLNFEHYRPGAEVTAVEPAPAMRDRAAKRVREIASTVPITLIDARARALPFDRASFDVVVTTFVLCSVGDAPGALAEIWRVLRPGGSLLIAEHVVDPDVRVRRWQQRVEPVWTPLLAGCRLTRDTQNTVASAGFDTRALRTIALPLPAVVRHAIVGEATRP